MNLKYNRVFDVQRNFSLVIILNVSLSLFPLGYLACLCEALLFSLILNFCKNHSKVFMRTTLSIGFRFKWLYRRHSKIMQSGLPNWIVDNSKSDSNNFIIRIWSNSKSNVKIRFLFNNDVNFGSILNSFWLNLSTFE